MLEGLTPPKSKAEYCKIDLMRKELSEKDYKILIEAIDNHDAWGARTLSNTLRQRGVSVADTTITKHRKKACACFRG